MGALTIDGILSEGDGVLDTGPGRTDQLAVAPRALGADRGLLGASPRQRWGKRALDVLGSLVLLLLLAPLMLVIALAVRMTSRGPALFRQTRVGQHGETFDFYKFRTMECDAEATKARLMSRNEASGPVFKIREDPRITSLGKVLRKASLDELPQLASVLAGHMSLVGPRPPLPDEVVDYSAWERQRLLVKPGLTCIWQVSGRSDLGFDRWVELDLDYIEQWTPALDLQILARTLPAVVSGRGAY